MSKREGESNLNKNSISKILKLYNTNSGYLNFFKTESGNKGNDPKIKSCFPEHFDIEWKDLSMFTVLTGKNGSGKSKILKLIRYGSNDDKNSIHLTSNQDLKNLHIILIHFDGNFTDLRGRNYLQIKTQNIETNIFLENSIKNFLNIQIRKTETFQEYAKSISEYFDKFYSGQNEILFHLKLTHFLNGLKNENFLTVDDIKSFLRIEPNQNRFHEEDFVKECLKLWLKYAINKLEIEIEEPVEQTLTEFTLTDLINRLKKKLEKIYSNIDYIKNLKNFNLNYFHRCFKILENEKVDINNFDFTKKQEFKKFLNHNQNFQNSSMSGFPTNSGNDKIDIKNTEIFVNCEKLIIEIIKKQ